MNQLKMKNPQMFQKINQIKNSNGNPLALFNEVTNGYSKEQLDSLFKRAKQMGVPEEYIKQVQNGIKQ